MNVSRLLVFVILLSLTCTLALAQTPDFDTLGRGLVTALADRQFDKVEARFDAQMKAALPATKLPEVWDSILAQAGPFKAIKSSKVMQKEGLVAAFVTCEFANALLDAKIYMDAQGQVKGLFFAPPADSTAAASAEPQWNTPSYVKTENFHDRDTVLTSGRWQLPGVLTFPNSKRPVPAVILVHGSGPHDADETVGPNKPFADLAYGLASQNIAVLRYVKRTRQYGADSKSDKPFTVRDETTDDVIAAVDLLSKMPEINKQQIYVLGHSLGGMLAPRIAQEDSRIAGLVILAGTARPLDKVVVEQIKYIASLTSPPTPENQKQVEKAEAISAQVENPALKPNDEVDFFGSKIPGSYFIDLRGYEPAKLAATLKIPILVLQGGHDYQVTTTDFDLWKAALGNDPRATFKFYPDYTHLFMPAPGKGPASPEDYSVPGNVSVDVVNDIASWIKGNAVAH